MRWIYFIIIQAYGLLIHFASIWNRKAKSWVDGRKGWRTELEGLFEREAEIAWFHCASLGEFEQGRPLMEAYREKYPDHKIILTFFSPSGFDKQKHFPGADKVCYLPLDSRRNAADFLKLVPAKRVFFVKYEFWFFFLREIHRTGKELYLISGIFRPGQLFFRWYGSWYRRVLGYFTRIFVQDESSEMLLRGFGIGQVKVAGDTRFDRVLKISEQAGSSGFGELFREDRIVVVAGSTWEKDEALLERVVASQQLDCNWIIAPHEPSSANLGRITKQFPHHTLLSAIKSHGSLADRIIIVDTIGDLSRLYHYGSFAYVGGGFGRGIHNILEAIAAGSPVFFGPNFTRFREAVELTALDVALPVASAEEMERHLVEFSKDPGKVKSLKEKAVDYMQINAGSTAFIMRNLLANC